MLLEFRVSNYRSFRDERVFSLVAMDKDKLHWDDNVYQTGNTQVPYALGSAVIYGPNASGKTNLIQAMGFFQALVRDSATLIQPGQPLNTQVFAFDEERVGQASSFEATFVLNGTRYQYGVTLTAERVQEEWLLAYKASKPQEWFSRTWNPQSKEDEYDFSKAYFPGNKEAWKAATRSNTLFFSVAVHWNNEQLRPIWNWIVNQWVVVQSNASFLTHKSIEYFEAPQTRNQVYEFLNSADFGIAEVTIKRQRVKQQGFQMDLATGQGQILDPVEVEQAQAYFVHQGARGTATLALGDESAGTQKHFALTGIVLHVLQTGSVLIADELENSLHPLLVRHIVKIFQSKFHNPKSAQLIFTTHNTSLMTSEFFRRDQIWFTEKDTDLATMLFSLLDFGGVRPTEIYEKRYLEGRYGAIPILSAFMSKSEVAHGE